MDFFTTEAIEDDVLGYEEKTLGDVFMEGMTQDLPIIVGDSKYTDADSLYACISYMYIQGLIGQETVHELMEILKNDSDNLKLTKMATDISKNIFTELIAQFDCKNVDELINKLNEYSVPQWCFDFGRNLVLKICKGLFFYNGFLYYLTEEKKFVKLEAEEIDSDEDLDSQPSQVIIGHGYAKLYGFNETEKLAYLEVTGQDNFYHSYNVSTDSYSVHKGQIITMHKNIPYVYKDEHIVSIQGKTVRNIKKVEPNEAVSCIHECLRILPAHRDKLIFYPYRIKFDGTKIPDNEDFCREYIWKATVFSDPLEYVLGAKLTGLKQPERLSVLSILHAYKEACLSPNGHKKIDSVLEETLDWIGKYVGLDKDITKLLYTFHRASYILFKEPIPSKKFLLRLKKLEKNQEELELFKAAIDRENYLVLEKLLSCCMNYKEEDIDSVDEGLIGYFKINGKNLETETFKKENGLPVGSLILPDNNLKDSRGMVYFDCSLNLYSVVYDKELKSEIRENIIKEFNLEDFEHSFFVLSPDMKI